jgi:hypothetical protein
MDQVELKEIDQRPLTYWSVDGLPELVASLGWLLWGGLYLMGGTLFTGRSYRTYSAVLWLSLWVWGFGVNWVMGKLKERLTYPRVGYATAPIRAPGFRVYVAFVLAMAVQWADSYGYRLIIPQGLGPVLIGGIVAVAIALPAMRPWTAYQAWFFLAFLGVQLWMLQRGADYRGMCWMLVCMGFIGIVFGALRLRRFLRENPKAIAAEA